MKRYYFDSEYLNKVSDILNNEEFKKMESIVHHEGNRLDHSIRVSYYSYKIAKALKMDTKQVARAALLHDFFLEENENEKVTKRMITMLEHPKYALKNSKKYFELTDMEEDIILTHMFPIGLTVPKYFESWMVDIVDDIASIYEKGSVVCRQFSTASSFLFMVLLNSLR